MTAFIARTPLDLLAVVPFVIGFHPDDSVVLLTFGSTGESFHARVDLPVTDEERDLVATRLRDVVAAHGVTQVGVVAYTEDSRSAEAFHHRLLACLLRAGIDVIDSLRVEAGRFHAADDPRDPGIPFDLSRHPFTAEQVFRGRLVHDNRDALRATLIGPEGGDLDDIAAAADAQADRLITLGTRGLDAEIRPPLATALSAELALQARWLLDLVRARVGHVPLEPLGATTAGRVLVLVALDSLREVPLAEMRRATAPAHLEFWRDLTRRAPRDLRAGPAALCAFAAWLNGEGALAWCALDRCFEVEPGDLLGRHVAALLDSATPPSVWAPTPAEALPVLADAAH